jgi:hypothetical protein
MTREKRAELLERLQLLREANEAGSATGDLDDYEVLLADSELLLECYLEGVISGPEHSSALLRMLERLNDLARRHGQPLPAPMLAPELMRGIDAKA